ncbi:membrane protein insertase YidC, partial [candidate division KSB1 bacterium]
WMTPSKEELAEQKRVQDSIVKVQTDSLLKVQQRNDSLKAIEIQKDTVKAVTEQVAENTAFIADETVSDDVQLQELKNKLGVFALTARGDDNDYIVENDLMKLTISSLGGRISSVELKDYQTYDTLPLRLFEKEFSKLNFSFFSQNRIINTAELYFEPSWPGKNTDNKSIRISGKDSLLFSMRVFLALNDSTVDRSHYIEFLYNIKGNNYMIGFDVNFVNTAQYITATNYINLEWSAELRKQEKTVNRFNGPTIYYKFTDEDIDFLSESKDDEENLPTRVKWVSFKQQFFATSLIAKDYFTNADIKVYTDKEKEEKGRYLRNMEAVIGVPFDNLPSQSIAMNFYFGPNKYKTLRQYDQDLERQIPLGWSFFIMGWINRFAVIPVFNYLESFHINYGIIILLLTIILKIVLFPIAYKTYMSSAKMRVLKPEVDEINKKFPKKEQAMDKQKATMALYKKAGANPMSGCVPMLLQMPILLALFRFFPASIELRQQSFLWATDLSSYDSIWTFPNGFSIPMYGDHISLFTLLMTVSTIIYTRINNQMMSSSQQMPGMKTMMYIMPLMFLGIFNNYSSGLSYYYFLANIFTFGQMYVIRQFVDEDKIHKRIQEHKKKPVKKSKFQQRIEDMAKQRGATPPKRK